MTGSTLPRPLGTDGSAAGTSLRKLATGIEGFDHVALGGLPSRRATVVAGQAGSAKTVFGAQFLAEGVRRGQPGVFVTLEEPAADLRANLATLGWDVASWEQAGDWRFVDASPLALADPPARGTGASIETLAALIGHAVDATGAERMFIDGLNGLRALHQDAVAARQQLRGVISALRAMGLTIVLTVETPGDPGGTLSLVERLQPSRLVIDSLSALERIGSGAAYREYVIGVTSFVKTVGIASLMTAWSPHLAGGTSVTESHISGLVDAVVVLRHVETDSVLRRGILVLKMRGSDHDHAIRELLLSPGSIDVGEPFSQVGGILVGQRQDRA